MKMRVPNLRVQFLFIYPMGKNENIEQLPVDYDRFPCGPFIIRSTPCQRMIDAFSAMCNFNALRNTAPKESFSLVTRILAYATIDNEHLENRIMPLPEFTRKLIETKLDEYCAGKIPAHARDQVRLSYKITGSKVILIESRPFYFDPNTWTETPLGQFRFDAETKKWGLYYMDRHSRWQLYDLVEESADFEKLLEALDEDRTGIFWG